MNGLQFDYDRTIKEILKALATDETTVNDEDVITYLRANTEPLAPEYEATIDLWLSRIDGTAQPSGAREYEEADENPSNEPNGYGHDSHRES